MLNFLRLDELHPQAPGNKYFKLKYNLLKAYEKGLTRIVTPGGPFSNHLHATAATCARAGLESIGLVHGKRPPMLSPTLKDCEAWGMKLEYLERWQYAERNTDAFKHWVHNTYGPCYWIPEGGNNYLGVQGCMEIIEEAHRVHDIIAVSVGTGTTLAGILLTKGEHQRVMAFPALEDRDLPKRVEDQLYWSTMDRELAQELAAQVDWQWDFTFGGFAKVTDELKAYILGKAEQGLPLDRVYTAKMVFGVEVLINEGYILPEEQVLIIHTGGLQGNRDLES